MNRYLVMVMRKPAFDVSLIESHRQFLADLRVTGRVELSGGFSDKSGGAYLLLAPTLDEATRIAQRDPLHLAQASQVTVYEWSAT